MRCLPSAADLWTWEWTTTYDKTPTEQELQESFERDYPETCGRVSSLGGRYWLWPLISFNSAEGRKFRYLVALPQQDDSACVEGAETEKFPSLNGTTRWRKLPEQIWIYGVADKMLRESSLDGTGLFYVLDKGLLTVLIFFEGRLCHWLEEPGFEGAGLEQPAELSVADRLESLRGFIASDALFGHCENMEFFRIALESGEPLEERKEKFFKRAAKDPFWKGLNLNKVAGRTCKIRGAWGWFVLPLLVAGLLLWRGVFWMPVESVVDAEPPQLTLSPEAPESTELRETFEIEAPREAKAKRLDEGECCPSALRVQGVVAGRLLVSTDGTFVVGDSLGFFQVQEILKDGVRFLCGNESFFVEVK